MGFMKPQYYETDYIEIDGPRGGEIIPCDVVDFKPLASMGGGVNKRFPIPTTLREYCENREAWSIERKHGWVGRMSAPGYLDCTPWESADSEEEIAKQLADNYGDEEV